MTYTETVEAERFATYKPLAPNAPKRGRGRPVETVPARQVEKVIEAAIGKAIAVIQAKHDVELEAQQKIFFNAGRFAAGAVDDTATKAHHEMLFILGE
jgi:hypothetical protein